MIRNTVAIITQPVVKPIQAYTDSSGHVLETKDAAFLYNKTTYNQDCTIN